MKSFSIAIAGGGSTYTPDMLEMLCLVRSHFPLRRVVLYDIDEERQGHVGRFGEILFREYYPEAEFSYTTDPETAFTDVDFVLVQIRAGGLKMRELDEKIPLKYGVIGQETCGPGGFAYGMRSVPAMIQLVKDIRRYSPEAWILNYSNPAAIVAEATKRIFPDDFRLINICDMPISIMDVFCPLAGGRKRTDVEPRYYGLNHFGWFTAMYDKKTGEDVLPQILEKLKKGGCDEELGFSGKNDEYWTFTFRHLEKMVQDYPHSLPNTYMQYYLYPQTMVDHSDPNYTRANSVMDGREKRVKEYCDSIYALGKIRGTRYDLDKKYSAGSHKNADGEFESATVAHNDAHATYIVELAMSIAYNQGDVFLLMTENNGIVPNLSDGMMLEVACRVGSRGAEPFRLKPAGTFEKGLLESQYVYEKLTVDAALEGSYQKALEALVVNRTVVDTDLARRLLNEYISVNGEYFPKLR